MLWFTNRRWPRYQVQRDRLVASGAEIEPYRYEPAHRVASRLAALTRHLQDDDAFARAAVEIAEVFGLLTDAPAQGLADEPLSEWREHAEHLHRLALLKRARGASLDRLLAVLADRQRRDDLWKPDQGGPTPVETNLQRRRPHEAAALRDQLLAEGVNENLWLVRRVWNPTERTSAFQSPTLAGVAYWEVADALDGGVIGRCQECGAFYFAHRERPAPFCPPWPGATNSRCQRRANQRAFRQRQPRSTTSVRGR